MIPFTLLITIDFYLLPMFIKETGSAMFILLVCIPMLCFIISIAYGLYQGFHWHYTVIVILLFIPTIFLFYNSSASFYAVVYGMIAIAGDFIGAMIHKHRNQIH